MLATNSFASVVMIANVLIHSPDAGSFQFSHMPPIPKGATSFHRDGVRLLRSLSLYRLPLEKSVHGHDAAALAVRIPERR
jgi:hypothetical protein